MQDIYSSMTNTTGNKLFAGELDQPPPIPHHHDNLKCPRCQSQNTKFCYYNNYNLSQPRHLCKSCRRYWTNGGVLRNVPVGGGIRKPKPKPKRSGKPKTGAGYSGVITNATTTTSATNTNYSNSENITIGYSGVTTNTTTKGNNNNYSSSENISSDCSGVTTNTKANTTAKEVWTSDPSSVKPDMMVKFNDLSAQMLCSPVGRFDMMLNNHSPVINELKWTEMETNMGFENMRSDGQVIRNDDRQNNDGEDFYDLSGTVDESYWCQNQWCDDDDDRDRDRGQLDCLP